MRQRFTLRLTETDLFVTGRTGKKIVNSRHFRANGWAERLY